MVTQNMLSTHEGTNVFSEKISDFCLLSIYSNELNRYNNRNCSFVCAPISELPSNRSSMLITRVTDPDESPASFGSDHQEKPDPTVKEFLAFQK